MENTKENKKTFFFQHYGQRVLKRKDRNSLSPVGFSFMSQYIFEDAYLSLKSLSSITNEDAIEVAKIANLPSFSSKKKWDVWDDKAVGSIFICSKSSHHDFLIDYEGYVGQVTMYDGDDKSEISIDNLRIFDYLRSKGYALPWMGVSVEKQIEYGWIKLKE